MSLISSLFDWLQNNIVEFIATITGLAYVVFSIKQKLATWFFGLVTSLIYIYIFFVAKIYADMALQFYYVWVSCYGWWIWTRGQKSEEKSINVTRLDVKKALNLLLITLVIYFAIYLILDRFTDSPIPMLDAFTTSLSIVATWMLARKIIEHWIIWVVVDIVSIGLYVYRELYITVVLFVVYSIAAIVGYVEWQRALKLQNEQAR